MSNDIKNAIVSYRAKDFCCIKSADYQKKKAQKSFKISVPFGINGALGEIRTPDLRIRSPLLYPAELQAQIVFYLSTR